MALLLHAYLLIWTSVKLWLSQQINEREEFRAPVRKCWLLAAFFLPGPRWPKVWVNSWETKARRASSSEIAGHLLGCQSAWRGDCLCAGGSRTSSSFRGADTQPEPLPSFGHTSASLGVLRALGSSHGFPASLPPDWKGCGGCGCHQLPLSLSCWLCDKPTQSPGDPGSLSVSYGGRDMKTEARWDLGSPGSIIFWWLSFPSFPFTPSERDWKMSILISFPTQEHPPPWASVL